jgi:hypothetical protein
MMKVVIGTGKVGNRKLLMNENKVSDLKDA